MRKAVTILTGKQPRYGTTKVLMKHNAADKTNLIRGRVTRRAS